MWDGFADAVIAPCGESATAFVQVFVNLLYEIKDGVRKPIFMKLSDFKVKLTCT